MKRTVIDTEDNSKTLLIDNTDVTYHSRHGAVTESMHIFIKNGLGLFTNKKNISVFEMGFGTGLNTVLALDFATTHQISILYNTIEKYPLNQTEIDAIGLTNTVFDKNQQRNYELIHNCRWELLNPLTEYFNFTKHKADLRDFDFQENKYDIIFFDAFGPKFQPDLWQPKLLKKMYNSLVPAGTLITYCAQGQFKRDLKSVGFTVENLPGPPGKREITRAIKQ